MPPITNVLASPFSA